MRDAMNYALAAVLLLASIPLYRYIIAHADQPDTVPAVVALAAPVSPLPRGSVEPAVATPSASYVVCSGRSSQPAFSQTIVTDRSDCRFVGEAVMAIEKGAARCLAGQLYAVHRANGVLEVRPWYVPVTCDGG